MIGELITERRIEKIEAQISNFLFTVDRNIYHVKQLEDWLTQLQLEVKGQSERLKQLETSISRLSRRTMGSRKW